MEGAVIGITSHVLSGLWLSHLRWGEESGRTRQLAVGEFCPASSPTSRANPVGFMGHCLTHQMTLFFEGRACFRLQKLSLCPLGTCLALELTMRKKGTVSRPVLKQNCVPVPWKGTWVSLQSPVAFTNTFFYDPMQWARYVRIFTSQSMNSGPYDVDVTHHWIMCLEPIFREVREGHKYEYNKYPCIRKWNILCSVMVQNCWFWFIILS